MLVQGSRVLTDEEGGYRPIELLKDGDHVFDPWTQEYLEILYIIARSVSFSRFRGQKRHPLRPVLFQAGCLGENRPISNVAVSPFQTIVMESQGGPDDGSPCTELITAERAEEMLPSLRRYRRNRARYFAIYTAKQQYLDVEGLLLPSYSKPMAFNTAFSTVEVEESREVSYMQSSGDRRYDW